VSFIPLQVSALGYVYVGGEFSYLIADGVVLGGLSKEVLMLRSILILSPVEESRAGVDEDRRD
jgi:hypothetical protein